MGNRRPPSRGGGFPQPRSLHDSHFPTKYPYANEAAAPPPPPPPPPPPSSISTFTPDEATLQRFKDDYAAQEGETAAEYLKKQQSTAHGTIGTLDVDTCLKMITNSDVSFIVTDTGTGKSTLIPMALHAAFPDALIVNAQPRRTAAINLAQRVSTLLGGKLGSTVGYSVRGEHAGELGETKVMYVTTYSLFLYFLWHEVKEKFPLSYIIIDEFHERTADVEVILLILKLWLQKNPGSFKLVLCSASAQVEEWQSFFDGLRVEKYSQCNNMYPIREYFLEDVTKLLGVTIAEPLIKKNNLVESLWLHQIMLLCKNLISYLVKATATADSILIFLPGRTQVEHLASWIRTSFEDSVEPISWYSSIDLTVIQEAIGRQSVSRKKIYVATDIAEVSLTLPDVVFVIDSGTGKRPQVSEKEPTSFAFPPLRLLWESAANAQQRRGRVGRVQQGFYFCLLQKDHFTSLRRSDSRIRNAVLNELVLHSLLITRKPFSLFQLCREKPHLTTLKNSLYLLQDNGFIIADTDPLSADERVMLGKHGGANVLEAPWYFLIQEAGTHQSEEKLTGSDVEDSTEDVVAQTTAGSGDKPQGDSTAFLQSYWLTLRGVLAARAPVHITAAANAFFGFLFGTPTLSILASAIEASRSPFYVPYIVKDPTERVREVRAVSRHMQRYHGELHSDLISSVEVVLEYMSMQRDGLSEEAQEEWCRERFVSRMRIVDSLNLFNQMKQQVGSVLPFTDVDDVDALVEQFNRHAELLVLMSVASHVELAIQVQLDNDVAVRRGFVGRGVFFPLRCLKDESVPTVCPWTRNKVSVPLSLQTIQQKVLAVFASQVEMDIFCLVVLVFSFRLHYQVLDNQSPPFYRIRTSHTGVARTFCCDVLTAQQIMQLRRIQCAQLRCMQLQVEEHVAASDNERLSAHLQSTPCDFGLPESAVQQPFLIPSVLQQGLKLLITRIRTSPALYASNTSIDAFPPGTAYCKLVANMPLVLPYEQSVLIHQSNGLSVVAAVPSLSQTLKSDGNAAGEDAAQDDDRASATSSEENVATFTYD